MYNKVVIKTYGNKFKVKCKGCYNKINTNSKAFAFPISDCVMDVMYCQPALYCDCHMLYTYCNTSLYGTPDDI